MEEEREMDDSTTTTTTFSGVIYSWTNTITDMSYIGSTKNEYNRKAVFKSKTKHYAGRKINEARQKFGVAAFQYQVLETITANDEGTLQIKLDEREAFYIQKYQSTITGYNTALYGKGQKGIKLSDATKRKMSDSHHKIAVKITDTSNNTTTTFPSMTAAYTSLSIPLSTMHKILGNGGGEWKNFKITAA